MSSADANRPLRVLTIRGFSESAQPVVHQCLLLRRTVDYISDADQTGSSEDLRQDAAMTAELKLGPIGQISRQVSDIPKAVEWYKNALGLPRLMTAALL